MTLLVSDRVLRTTSPFNENGPGSDSSSGLDPEQRFQDLTCDSSASAPSNSHRSASGLIHSSPSRNHHLSRPSTARPAGLRTRSSLSRSPSSPLAAADSRTRIISARHRDSILPLSPSGSFERHGNSLRLSASSQSRPAQPHTDLDAPTNKQSPKPDGSPKQKKPSLYSKLTTGNISEAKAPGPTKATPQQTTVISPAIGPRRSVSLAAPLAKEHPLPMSLHLNHGTALGSTPTPPSSQSFSNIILQPSKQAAFKSAQDLQTVSPGAEQVTALLATPPLQAQTTVNTAEPMDSSQMSIDGDACPSTPVNTVPDSEATFDDTPLAGSELHVDYNSIIYQSTPQKPSASSTTNFISRRLAGKPHHLVSPTKSSTILDSISSGQTSADATPQCSGVELPPLDVSPESSKRLPDTNQNNSGSSPVPLQTSATHHDSDTPLCLGSTVTNGHNSENACDGDAPEDCKTKGILKHGSYEHFDARPNVMRRKRVRFGNELLESRVYTQDPDGEQTEDEDEGYYSSRVTHQASDQTDEDASFEEDSSDEVPESLRNTILPLDFTAGIDETEEGDDDDDDDDYEEEDSDSEFDPDYENTEHFLDSDTSDDYPTGDIAYTNKMRNTKIYSSELPPLQSHKAIQESIKINVYRNIILDEIKEREAFEFGIDLMQRLADHLAQKFYTDFHRPYEQKQQKSSEDNDTDPSSAVDEATKLLVASCLSELEAFEEDERAASDFAEDEDELIGNGLQTHQGGHVPSIDIPDIANQKPSILAFPPMTHYQSTSFIDDLLQNGQSKSSAESDAQNMEENKAQVSNSTPTASNGTSIAAPGNGSVYKKAAETILRRAIGETIETKLVKNYQSHFIPAGPVTLTQHQQSPQVAGRKRLRSADAFYYGLKQHPDPAHVQRSAIPDRDAWNDFDNEASGEEDSLSRAPHRLLHAAATTDIPHVGNGTRVYESLFPSSTRRLFPPQGHSATPVSRPAHLKIESVQSSSFAAEFSSEVSAPAPKRRCLGVSRTNSTGSQLDTSNGNINLGGSIAPFDLGRPNNQSSLLSSFAQTASVTNSTTPPRPSPLHNHHHGIAPAMHTTSVSNEPFSASLPPALPSSPTPHVSGSSPQYSLPPISLLQAPADYSNTGARSPHPTTPLRQSEAHLANHSNGDADKLFERPSAGPVYQPK